MIHFSNNLRFLRENKYNFSLSKMSNVLSLKRQTYSGYEAGTSQPYLKEFIKIAEYFGVSEYELLHKNLSSEGNLILKADEQNLPIKGNLKRNLKGNLISENSKKSTKTAVLENKIITLPLAPHIITVDTQGNDNVVMVPVRARAGYLQGYGDPEFMSTLPTYRLPGLSNGTYRIFEVEGNSMYNTLNNKDLVISQYINDFQQIRDDRIYVIITKSEGILIKRVLNRIKNDSVLILKSDNINDRHSYPNIVINFIDIAEIWYVNMYVSRHLPQPSDIYNRINEIEAKLTLLEHNSGKISK